MPYVRAADASNGDWGAVVDTLVQELKSPRPIGQPIIREDGGGESVRVQVAWDRWAEVSGETRSAIILDAYAKAFGQTYRDKIKMALGMTVPEAADVGLLPCQVVPFQKKGEGPPPEEYQKAMVESGASLLFGDGRPQLRFATLEDAEAAIEHLQHILPNSNWIIKQEVYSFPSSGQ